MLNLDKTTFQKEVLEQEGYVLVDFWNERCAACKALMPNVISLSEKYGNDLKFTKLDTSNAARLSIKQKVLGLPTIAIYKNGEKIDELTKGDATLDKIEKMINKYI